jgi:bacteriophage CI repressor helix-turn-helix domain
MSFKDRLRQEIEYKGLLVKELSAEVGISNSTFLSYIDARGVLPNVETAVKIASALGVSVEYLVTGKEPIYNSKQIDIQDITHDLIKLTPYQIEIIKKMVHALV